MTETNNILRRLLRLSVKAFILASVVAVLMLTLGVGVVLLLLGFLARKLKK